MDMEAKFEFFKLCAEEQNYSSRTICVFDNKLDRKRIPEKAKKKYGDKQEVEEWYTEFTRNKFAYFTLLLGDTVKADREMNRMLGDEATLWTTVLKQWRKQADRERAAYLQRITQIPKDTVIHFWYNDLPELQDWAKLCEEADNFKPIFRPSSNKTRRASCSTRVIRIYETIAPQFVGMLGSWNVNQQDYIRLFLELLQNEFPCDICDYLEVQGERVVLTSTTVDFKSIADKFKRGMSVQELQDELAEGESYLIGEGISGCILMYPKQDCRWFHVGSDNLREDLRRQVGKQELYEELYHDFLKAGKGKICNFWMFPIAVGNGLRATFRVVNRRDASQNLLPSGWPEKDRLELCELARRFSILWEQIQLSPIVRRPSLAEEVKERDVFISNLVTQLDLGWVSEVFLSMLITHLQNVAFRKVETRSVGCSIVVVHKTVLGAFLQMFQKYDLIKETRMQISQLAKYYDGVLPSTVAFVFNEQGGYESAIKLDQHSPSTEYPIAATTKHWDKTVAFLVEKKEKPDQNIMIYRKGYPVAQRYYGERSGDWQGRFWGAMLQKIRVATLNLLNFNEDVIYRVFREACNLSSCREGAKIIIADPEEISDAFFPDEKKGVGREINAPIFSMSSNDFVETAKGDGSVIIARDGMIQKVGIFLEPKTHVELTVELSTLLKARGPGGRHESAIKECCACRTALIFIVSQNRSISVLHCGSAIEWEL